MNFQLLGTSTQTAPTTIYRLIDVPRRDNEYVLSSYRYGSENSTTIPGRTLMAAEQFRSPTAAPSGAYFAYTMKQVE